MGLDMHLSAKKYVGGWNHSDADEKKMFAALVSLIGISPTAGSPSFEVSADIAYWRKANAVHRWFVENVQNGDDDCGEYYVSRDQLSALRDDCRKALSLAETVADPVSADTSYYPDGRVEHHTVPGRQVTNAKMVAEVMPTQSGFFFGKTDYDSDYLDDLRDTVEVIDRILSDPALADGKGWEFYYSSSW